jgi:hypothetical protein
METSFEYKCSTNMKSPDTTQVGLLIVSLVRFPLSNQEVPTAEAPFEAAAALLTGRALLRKKVDLCVPAPISDKTAVLTVVMSAQFELAGHTTLRRV